MTFDAARFDGVFTALVTLMKGLQHVGLDLSLGQSYAYAAVMGLAGMVLGGLAWRMTNAGKA